MLDLNQIRGLKGPDVNCTRFFFKEGLNLKTGRVLELGCSNGRNLQLFRDYGWEILGVDLSGQSIEDARYNLKLTNEFICSDMLSFVKNYNTTKPFDVLLFPSSLYYLKHSEINELLGLCVKKKFVTDGSKVFFHMRSFQDYRYGRGQKVEPDCFLLDIDETGEKGCTISFFNEFTFMSTLQKYFKFSNCVQLKLNFDNIQNNRIIYNSDIIVYGTIMSLNEVVN